MSAPLPDLRSADRADLAACRVALANGSRTFLAASWLLPRAVREPACALYAFCRMADDLVDGAAARGERAADAVAELRDRLARLYAGQPGPHVADRALAAVVRGGMLPIAWPLALIEGFEWDATGRRYETLDEVLAYGARVAGAVGAMMAALMGATQGEHAEAALARACDLGVAMQLSNIARDVGEDAAMGRLYLPQQWLREAGIDPEAFLAAPVFSPALREVVERLLAEAERLYTRAGAGVAALPLACRPGINAARLLYRQIGRQVQRNGGNSVDQRAVVSARRKLLGLGQAACSLRPSLQALHEPPLAATAFLVQALPRPLANTSPAWWQWQTRGLRVLALFERLERERARGAAACR
ncbi:phytoene/squalene synthase family protein [Ideonella aquatica]|uniref:phytoene/squalene synthase family protein n=1 Tax=Ideonella aquatica TaxID=2824119 RepID=UPI001FFC737B|nr:phytoene/squalene synthase family protein [Ideonella aquatica]